jgi:hypothetical protein
MPESEGLAETDGGPGIDLWLDLLGKAGPPRRFRRSERFEQDARRSPNGRLTSISKPLGEPVNGSIQPERVCFSYGFFRQGDIYLICELGRCVRCGTPSQDAPHDGLK